MISRPFMIYPPTQGSLAYCCGVATLAPIVVVDLEKSDVISTATSSGLAHSNTFGSRELLRYSCFGKIRSERPWRPLRV